MHMEKGESLSNEYPDGHYRPFPLLARATPTESTTALDPMCR